MEDHYNVVIQLSNDGTEVQKATITQVKNLLSSLPGTQVEIVVQSRGINFVFKNTHWEFDLEKLVKHKTVKILVCRNTLEAIHLRKEDILPFIEIIPSAIAHIVKRQYEGWSYLKAGF